MRFKHFGELRVSQRNFFFLTPSLTEVTGPQLPLRYSAHFFSFTQLILNPFDLERALPDEAVRRTKYVFQ